MSVVGNSSDTGSQSKQSRTWLLGGVVELLGIWIASSIGFAAGWIVRSGIARHRAQEPSHPLHTIDVRLAPWSSREKTSAVQLRTIARAIHSNN